MEQVITTAQQRFEEIYITSTEICQRLSVNRASITQGRKRGMLPDPIVIRGSNQYLWEREKVEPFLKAWAISLSARRGELVK